MSVKVSLTQHEIKGWVDIEDVDGWSFAGWTEASGVGADGKPALDYMIYNEFGTARIPSRPAVRQAFDNHKDEYIEQMEADSRLIVNGKMTVSQSLTSLANKARNHIIGEILNPSPEFAPNAPETIARKGSSRPLVDTGLAMSRVVTGVES